MPPHTFFDSRNFPGILLFRVGNGLCSSCGWRFGSSSSLRRSLGLACLLRSLRVRRFTIHKLCFGTIAGGDLGLPVGIMRRALGIGPAENRPVDSGWQEKDQGYHDRSFQRTYLSQIPINSLRRHGQRHSPASGLHPVNITIPDSSTVTEDFRPDSASRGAVRHAWRTQKSPAPRRGPGRSCVVPVRGGFPGSLPMAQPEWSRSRQSMQRLGR
jgi:hypothetical protein